MRRLRLDLLSKGGAGGDGCSCRSGREGNTMTAGWEDRDRHGESCSMQHGESRVDMFSRVSIKRVHSARTG